MGGIVKSLFGGSSKTSTQQSTQESGNHNESLLTNALSPTLNATGASTNALMSLLGLSGGGAQAAAQANFQNTPGYQFARDQGLSAVSQKGFVKGLGNSGATLKALDKFGTGLADQTYQNYMAQLTGLGNTGLQAGQVIGNAGQYSKQQSTGSSNESSNTGNLGKAIGFGLSLLSDLRTKQDIVKVGEHEGLDVCEFAYKDNPKVRYTGLIAQQVKEVFPEAVGNFFGYYIVDYAKIPNWSN